MTQNIPLDKLSIKDDSFHLLKSLPVELFNKTVKDLHLQDLVNLHDEAPGSDRFNDQIYALTLETLTIMDGSDVNDRNRVHLPAKFYGNSRVFCPAFGIFSLDIRYLCEFPEHLKQYVKNVEVDCFRRMPPEDWENIKKKQGSVSATVASFVNSFPQLDLLHIMTPHVKFQDKIVTQVKELWCNVYDNVLDSFSTEHLEILKLDLLEDDSTVAAPKYKLDSVEFSQKLGEYRLPKLHTLRLVGYPSPAYWEIDFQYFKNMPQLATCHFDTCKVLNLKEEYAPKLQSVTTYGSHIDEIALPQLTTFDNVRLRGEATETYGSLERLTTLKLYNCGLSSAKKLSNLQHLEALDLSYNSIENLEPVGQLKFLKVLEAPRNSIKVIPSLDKLTHLTKLDLSKNDITTITGLENLSSLAELMLGCNNLTSLSGLSGLINLRVLDVTANRDLRALGDALSRCRKLEFLSLNDCAIEKLEGLDNLTRLEELLVSDNNLTVLGRLDGQKQSLKILQANSNKIATITQDLSQFSALEELSLGGNKLVSFENINSVPGLEILHLLGNPVAQVDRALSYPKLGSIDIRDTDITSMEGLEGLEEQVPEVREQVEHNLQYGWQGGEGYGGRVAEAEVRVNEDGDFDFF